MPSRAVCLAAVRADESRYDCGRAPSVIIPLATGISKRADGFTPEARLRNMYCEKDASGLSADGTLRIQRPGLSPYKVVNTPVRALDYRYSSGEEIAVGGGRLYANGTSVGTIGGSGIAPTVATAFALFVIGGTTLYLYDTTLSTVTIPDDYTAQDVDQLNQYGLVLTSDGSGRFYWIVPGDTTIDPLNFATAESSADKGVALRRVGDEFVILGAESGEWWQATGDLDAPFQRVSGRSIDRGCLARDTVRRFDNSLMWVADNGEVVRLGPVPQVVSDPALTERIRKRGGDPSALVFSVDGHEFYVLTVPGQGTFAYDASTQLWCEFATYGENRWLPQVSYEREGVSYLGSSNTGKIWRLDPSNGTDDGTLIERIVTAIGGFTGKVPPNYNISIGVGVSADTVIRVRWRDGQEAYPDSYYDEIPVRAPFDVANMYRLGRPREPYREYEISCIAPERIRIAGMRAGEAWQ